MGCWPMKILRRARSLMVFWLDDELVVENYLTKSAYAVSEDLIRVLTAFTNFTTTEAVSEQLSDYDAESVSEAVSVLVDCGFLLEESASADDDALDSAWSEWPQDARYFHFSTKDAPYVEALPDELKIVEEIIDGPQPPIVKAPSRAPHVYLPRDFIRLDALFYDVLLARRTHRRFVDAPLSVRVFSTLMHLSFGPMQFIDAGVFGTLMMKNSAAAGARHELEHYVAVLNVDSIDPGLYHYDLMTHSLELIDSEFSAADAVRLTYEQEFCGSGAFTIFTTAVVARMMSKYRHPRAYRAILMDLGHQAQTFASVATALHLGPFQTAAIKDAEVEQALGIDGFRETAMYCMGAGLPDLDARGMAVDAAPIAGGAAWNKTTWLR